jgi:hypothetical protein
MSLLQIFILVVPLHILTFWLAYNQGVVNERAKWLRKQLTIMHYSCGCKHVLIKGAPLECSVHGNSKVVKYTNEDEN